MFYHKKGFTLIEMLLVIALIGVVALLSVSTLQKRAQNNLVLVTAAQMKQWLEASLAYYVKNGKWPQTFSDLENNQFLPDSAQCSPILQAQSTPHCEQKGEIGITLVNNDPIASTYITVSTPVTNEQLGQNIASQLPNSFYNGSVVRASVGVPGSTLLNANQNAGNSNETPQGYIASAGIIQGIDNGFLQRNLINPTTPILYANAIPLPKCQANMTGHIILSVMQTTTSGADSKDDLKVQYIAPGIPVYNSQRSEYYINPIAYGASTAYGSLLGYPEMVWDTPDTRLLPNQPTITYKLASAQGTTNKGKAYAPYFLYFLAVCLPARQWIANPHFAPAPSTLNPWNTPLFDAASLQDGHDAAWTQYFHSTGGAGVTYMQPTETGKSGDTCIQASFPYTQTCSGASVPF